MNIEDKKKKEIEGQAKKKKEREGILGIINEIMEKASDGEYIYRGQSSTIFESDIIPESDATPQSNGSFPQVTSTLYRTLYRALCHTMKERRDDEWHEEGVNERIDMNLIQEEVLNSARDFAGEDNSDDKMLSLIQHYSGDTNLIDFTKDYLVALFFACNQKYGEEQDGGKDGQVFLLEIANLKDNGIETITPAHPLNRITAQKSVFLKSPTGIISNEMKIVKIHRDSKQPILDYLKAHHNISLPSIYNDLHGYIRNHKEHGKAVMEFNLGIYYSNKSENAQYLKKKSDALKKAMGHFNKAIQIDPKYVRAYNGRGNIKQMLDEVPEAISDYNKAIELNPKYARAYGNRGLAKCKLGYIWGTIEWDDVMRDYDKAIVLAPNDAVAYNNRGNAKLQLGDESGAMRDYDKAVELGPNDAAAYYNRGLAKERLGGKQNLLQALSDFENAKNLAEQQSKRELGSATQGSVERVTEKIGEL